MTLLVFPEHPKSATFAQILVTVSASSQNTNQEDIVTLDKFLSLYKPPFPYLHNGNNLKRLYLGRRS